MKAISRILVPVDFSDCARAALQHGIELARALDAGIEILHVYEPPYYVGDLMVALPDQPAVTVQAYVRDESERLLAEMIGSVEGLEHVNHTKRLISGVPHRVISEQANGYDLVVMGTHGRGGLAHLLMGSVAEKVIRSCPCPVMVVKEPG